MNFLNVMNFKERRASIRFIVHIPIIYSDLELNKEMSFNTCDISEEGIGVMADKVLAPGTDVDIFLEMKDNGEKIYIRGKLVWSSMFEADKYRCGVKIEEPKLKPIPLVLRAIRFPKQNS